MQPKKNLHSTKNPPTKWAIGIVVLLLAYAAAQPLANSRLGWKLPSLASLLQQDAAGDPNESAGSQSQGSRDDDALLPAGASTEAAGLRYGLLRETTPDVFLSPAGLRYTPMGGPEQHRLEHIQRHLSDQTERPGKHGVFGGDMTQVLRWIDEAYERGRRGASGTRKYSEEGRDVYEVAFSQSVGYVGGQQGKRERNPEAHSIRLVLEGDRVITAFPF